MKKVLFLLMFCVPLMAQITVTPQGISSLDSSWSSIRVDQIFSTDGGDVLMDRLTVDTVIVNKYIEEKHYTLIDSLSQWLRDSDEINIDASKSANFIETKDEGVTVMNVDSTGNLGARNLTGNKTYSAELITGLTAMSTWTPAGNWTYSTKWDHATGSATALVANWTPTATTWYEFSYTITTSVAGTGVTPSCGGYTFPNQSAAGTYGPYNFKASTTGAPTFTPGSLGTWVGSITNVTIKSFTNGELTATNGNFSGQIFMPMGNATYPSLAFRQATTTGLSLVYASGTLPGLSIVVGGTTLFTAYSSNFRIMPLNASLGFRAGFTTLFSDANDQLIMRNGATPQRFDLANTYTSATSFESGSLNATASALNISTQHGSAGDSARPITFTVGGATPWIMTPGGKFSNLAADTATYDFRISGKASIRDTLALGRLNATDQLSPKFTMKGDADADASAITPETMTWSLTSNANPALATWGVTSTQGAGYTFDKNVEFNTGVIYATGVSAGTAAFSTNASADTVTVTGGTTISVYNFTWTSAPGATAGSVWLERAAGSFIVHTTGATIGNPSYTWSRAETN